LAGRRAGCGDDAVSLILVATILRLAGAIVLEALALTVWNIGTRSPFTLLRDIARALRLRRGLFAGFVSLIVGFVFTAAATVLMLPVLPDPQTELVPLEIFTFIAALAIEHLVGPDLRRLAGSSSSEGVR
jgi:hypothetical protein